MRNKITTKNFFDTIVPSTRNKKVMGGMYLISDQKIGKYLEEEELPLVRKSKSSL